MFAADIVTSLIKKILVRTELMELIRGIFLKKIHILIIGFLDELY